MRRPALTIGVLAASLVGCATPAGRDGTPAPLDRASAALERIRGTMDILSPALPPARAARLRLALDIAATGIWIAQASRDRREAAQALHAAELAARVAEASVLR